MKDYKAIYTLPFKSINETTYFIEIQKENYMGESTELTGSGDTPFSVSIEDEDFLYIPTRFSTATIRIVGGDYLQSLYSTGYQQYRVLLKRENKVVWTGFITPELYTQDYSAKIFEFELGCVSAMSSLEYINYKQLGESKAFVSLWDLLKKCISSANGQYSSVIFPYVYAKSKTDYDADTNVLKDMTISEQNFFDEDDKAMTLKGVLEEVCKFLNWTCVDWMGDLYFVDIDDAWRFDKYKPDLSERVTFVIPLMQDIQNIGFAGSNHSLDILPGYNKATVKCSNYPIGEINISENFDKPKLLSNVGDVSTPIGNGVTRYTHREVLYPNNLQMSQFTYKGGVLSSVDVLDKYKDNPDAAELLGAIPLRYATYESGMKNPNVQTYSYEEALQIRQRSWLSTSVNDESNISVFDGSQIVIKAKNEALYFNKGGALSLSMSIKVLQKDKFGGGMIPSADGITYNKDRPKISVRIGNKYVAQDSNGRLSWNDNLSTITPNLEQSQVENADGKMGTGFVSLHKTYGVIGKYSEADGLIIEIPSALMGTLELSIYAPAFTEREKVTPYGFIIKDLKLRYCPPLYADHEDNSDRIYENVVNKEYINELDEIEFKISSYNNDGACYSKVILDGEYLTDNLYSSVANMLIRPEEHLIKRIISQYGATKIKLTQVLKNSESITPISTMRDKHMGVRSFIVTGGEIDFASEQFTCKMIENNAYSDKK